MATESGSIKSDQKEAKQMDNYECVCGKSFIKIFDGTQLYNNRGVCCDMCGVNSKKNDIYWHCGRNAIHTNGFDVCNNCIGEYNVIQFRDIQHIIDYRGVKTIRGHNTDNDASSITLQQLLQNNHNYKSYVISDCDEELMILIEFKYFVAVKSIQLYVFRESINYIRHNTDDNYDASMPQKIHIYKIHNVDEEMADITTLPSDLSVEYDLSSTHTESMELITKKCIACSSIKCLAIYIESNQNDTEKTYINGIKIIAAKSQMIFTSNTLNEQRVEDMRLKYSQNKQEFVKPPKINLLQDNMCINLRDVCQLSKCKHLKSLVAILKRYSHFIAQKQQSKTNDDLYENKFDDSEDIYYHDIEQNFNGKSEHKITEHSITEHNNTKKSEKKSNEQLMKEVEVLMKSHHEKMISMEQNIAKNKERMVNEKMRQKVLIYATKHKGSANDIMTQYVSEIMKIKQQQQQMQQIRMKKVKEFESSKIKITNIDYQNEETTFGLIDNLYISGYHHANLLNDFHHLMATHSQEFEDIYNILTDCRNIGQCDLQNCLLFRRNHRNRFLLGHNDVKLREMYFNLEEKYNTLQQQLLDKIHCFFFHSYDVGYRMTKQETERIIVEENKVNSEESNHQSYNKMIQKINDLNKMKNESRRKMNELQNLRETSKFVTEVKKDELIMYSNGFRYFYWDFYKTPQPIAVDIMKPVTGGGVHAAANHGYVLLDWYIAPLFENLKVEITNNKICTIGNTQWNGLVACAQAHIQSVYFKQICCNTSNQTRCYEIYGIHLGSSISIDHIAAMMIYCNYDFLQRKFSETYRKVETTETDEKLKKRHQNYFHLGRLLRECVECFGVPNVNYLDFINLRVFHGISEKTHFTSSVVCFKGPVSTTTVYGVAGQFCIPKGIVLELNLDQNWSYAAPTLERHGMAMCELFWLSDFPNEQERFFIGGYSNFGIVKIILAENSHDYSGYTFALCKLLGCIASDRIAYSKDNMLAEIDEHIIDQILFRMLLHELHFYYPNNKKYSKFESIPSYVEQLLHRQCIGLTYLKLFGPTDTFVVNLMEILFFYDYGWINLDKLLTVFPSTQRIHFSCRENDDEFMVNESIYLSILSFLRNNPDTVLEKIDIAIPRTQNAIARATNICQQFSIEFNQIQYTMILNDIAMEFDVFIQIDKDMDIIERNTLQIAAKYTK